MNCPKCQTQNEENAQFCRNCGTNMHYFPEATDSSKTADLLIMIFLIYMFVSEIARFAIQELVDNWYEGTSKNIIIGINLIAGISVILLGLSIKNKTSKIFGIILASIYAIYIIYSNISWLVR
jgi:hypothetical protein